jgi:DNA-binding NarL/FixJ family response regulator
MQKPPLRGRASERELIDGLLRAAGAGRGSALLIRGEPGMGKSALLAHVAAAFVDRGAESAVNRPGPDTGTGVEADATVLRTAGLAEEAALPYAALHRFVQPLADRVTALPGPQRTVLERALSGDGCPAADRLRLSTAVLRLIADAARHALVLGCVDDAHLLDPASVDALAFAARRLGPHRAVLLFTASGDQPAVSGVRCRWISGLDRSASRDLLTDLVPGGLPTDVAGALVDLARGNPQALVDLARSLTPAQRRGEAPLPVGLPVGSRLRDAYRARLDRLPAPTRWLLLLAAADDRLGVTELVAAARASGTDVGGLAPAELCGLVRVQGDRLTFPQPLARAATYDESPLGQRRAAHLVLSTTLDPVRHGLRVALHRAAAGTGGLDPARVTELADELAAAARQTGGAAAADALERAAELTADPALAAARLVDGARYAWLSGHPHRARMLLRKSGGGSGGLADLLAGEMELRSGAPATALRSLLDASDRLPIVPGLAVRALARAGDAISFSGDYMRFPMLERRVAALPPVTGQPDAELMRLYIAGLGAMFRDGFDHAVGPLRRVVTLGRQLSEPGALTWASAASMLLGDDATARHLAGRAIDAAGAAEDVSMIPRAREMKAYAEYWSGRLDAVETTCLDGVCEAEASGQDNCADSFRAMLAVVAALRGDEEACRRFVAAATRRPSADQVNRPRALSRWALAILDLGHGRLPEAASRIEAIADPVTGRGQVFVHVMATPYLVEAAATGSARRTAVGSLQVFDRWATGTGDAARRAIAARCNALLARRGSQEADELFRAALRLHQAGANEFELARTQLLYGRELRRHRRGQCSRDQVRAALATFERLGCAVWAAQARAELHDASEPAPVLAGAQPRAPVSSRLTAQQVQIARMVAAGATNREVAEQLYLSIRTVDHHMRNIFVRLGIRSRIELAKLFS